AAELVPLHRPRRRQRPRMARSATAVRADRLSPPGEPAAGRGRLGPRPAVARRTVAHRLAGLAERPDGPDQPAAALLAGPGPRAETSINQADGFCVYRTKEGDETGVKSWRPLRKGVADLHRQAEVSHRANERFVESLATVADPTPLGQLLAPLGRPVIDDGRRFRALNPLTGADGELLRTVARGEFLLQG